MSLMQIVITSIISLAIGIFMGIIGGGGGGIYVVVIMLFFHQDVKTSVGTALILSTITLSSAAWQYFRKKQVRMDYFIALSIFGVIGTVLGSLLMKFVNETVLKVSILCVFTLSGLTSIVKLKTNSDDKEYKVAKVRNKMFLVAPLGIVSGLITGALGLSGATALSSFLIGLLDFSPYLAVGTTTMIAMILNLSGAIFHAASSHINFEILIILGLGSAFGAFFGARMAEKINRKALTVTLGLMTIVSGVYMAIHK